MAKTRRPDLFKNTQKHIKQMELSIEDDFLTAVQNDAQKLDNVEIKRMPKYLQVTEKRMAKRGIIDMKPYFRNSSKAKTKKNGGWYLIIPIKMKTSKMSKSLYNQLNSVKPTGTYTNTLVSYLDATKKSSIPHFNPPSRNKSTITKVTKPGASKSTYVKFRTVSDKSPAGSWIINRGKINREEFSKTTYKHMEYLAKWRAKHLFK